jgi:hypothetical protein
VKAQQELAEKVALAEAAVQSVKDPELRRVAFEKVLEKLLSDGEEKSQMKERKEKASSSKKVSQGKLRGGPKSYVLELLEEGFFSKPKGISEVQKALGDRGHHIALTSLSGPLQSLCRDRKLRRQQNELDGKGSKKVYLYSKW